LLIGFTRNWPQLLQCVVSYIAAGWPAEEIYVVENTGTMLSNKEGKLTLQNPFYLNHTQLEMLGVNVIIVSFQIGQGVGLGKNVMFVVADKQNRHRRC